MSPSSAPSSPVQVGGDTVADYLVNQLLALGVRRIYGIVGDSLNPIVDAVRRSNKDGQGIQWIHVRHEESAAFAAAAEAETTGNLAVCAGSCGPGNLHLINGLYDANRNRVPVLAIASHIPSLQIGTRFFQETHPDRLFNECSVFNEMITNPDQAPRVVTSAIQHAWGAPGVAVLTIPGDTTASKLSPTLPFLLERPESPRVLPSEDNLRELAAAINAAKKVTIFAGAGTKGAHDEVIALAERIGAPIGHSLRGKEYIQWDNPYDVGMSGLLGYGSCQEAMYSADLLILLGTDFPYSQFLPESVRTAQIDIRPEVLGRRTRADIAVVGDVKETAKALLPLIGTHRSHAFATQMTKKFEKSMKKVVGAYRGKSAATLKPLHPEYVADILSEVAADDAIFTVDTGMGNVWAARYLRVNGRRRVIGSFLHGSMANALPNAIGAAAANPGRQVISMSGDGGLSMLLGELITIKNFNLGVKVVVFNNASLGMVKLEMLVDGLPSFGTESEDVDYAAIAAGIGIPSVRIKEPGTVREQLQEALAQPGPGLIELMTDPRALSLPASVTADQITGFASAMTKEVLGGGMGEVVSMARSNLRNIGAVRI